MSPSTRFPLQLTRENGSDPDRDEGAGIGALAKIYLLAGSCGPHADLKAAWNCVTEECEALLQLVRELSPAVGDRVALRILKIVRASYNAGAVASFRESAALQGERARSAKKRKTDLRGQIIRRAVVSVCHQQRLAPVASQKFAHSIRREVIEAAAEFGLVDTGNGTSARSIQRHIAALLKDLHM